jgi:hypothetical protein
MSGTASRYIGGVPYAPGMGVGRYPNAASLLSAPGPRSAGSFTPASLVDASGIAVNPQAGAVRAAGGEGGGNSNLLLAAALGLLGYAPDAYSAVRDLVGGSPQQSFPADPTPLSDGGGSNAPQYVQDAQDMMHRDGLGFSPYPIPQGVPPEVFNAQEFMHSDPGAFLGTPGPGGSLAPVDGFTAMGAAPGDFVSTSAPAPAQPSSGVQGGSFSAFNNPLGLPPEFMGTDPNALGSVGGYDVLASAAYLPAAIIGRGSQTLAKRGGEMGATIGSAAGGIIGGVVGGPVGAGVGALAGGAIGGQIGPNPTIGRNFSAIGTFDGAGNPVFGSAGGDNGGDASGALGFANDFGRNLLARAGQQGFSFNPNMAGAQFRVGGYDNFSRTGQTEGGFFYTPDTAGGSPENYALRPGGGLEAYSPQQQGALTDAVLADLAARDVFIPQGSTSNRGLDYYGATQGAGLGWYGFGDPFSQMLYDRQANVGGWTGGAMDRQFANDQMMVMRDAGYAMQADGGA